MNAELDDPPALLGQRGRLVGAAILFFTATAALLGTMPHYGMAVDEATYVWVAEEARRWFAELPEHGRESLSAAGLARRWHFLEDPAARAADRHSNFNLPFSCHWMNVGWCLSRWFTDELTASRMGSVLLLGICIAAVFALVTERYGALGGTVAAAAMLLTPRVFAHAHFAATDTPLAACWTIALLLLARLRIDLVSGSGGLAGADAAAPGASTRTDPTAPTTSTGPSWRRGLFVALFVGLVFANKLTGWLLAGPTLLWLFSERPRGWPRLALLFLVVPLLTVVVMTPNLWHDPLGGLARYLQAALDNPWKIPSYYLGAGYRNDLPWTSGPVLVAVTTPIVLLALSLIGAIVALKDRWSALFLWNAALLLGVRAVGKMPQHDVERQILPFFYFAAVLAGTGAAWTARVLRQALRRNRLRLGPHAARCLGAALALLLLAEPLYESVVYRRHALSYYNRLIGGLPGARRLGLETNYWFESATPDVWRQLCQALPQNARVFLRPDHPGLEFLIRQGRWRADLKSAGPAEADFYILTGRRAAYLVEDPNSDRLLPTDLLHFFESAPATVEVRFLGVRLLALVPVHSLRSRG